MLEQPATDVPHKIFHSDADTLGPFALVERETMYTVLSVATASNGKSGTGSVQERELMAETPGIYTCPTFAKAVGEPEVLQMCTTCGSVAYTQETQPSD